MKKTNRRSFLRALALVPGLGFLGRSVAAEPDAYCSADEAYGYILGHPVADTDSSALRFGRVYLRCTHKNSVLEPHLPDWVEIEVGDRLVFMGAREDGWPLWVREEDYLAEFYRGRRNFSLQPYSLTQHFEYVDGEAPFQGWITTAGGERRRLRSDELSFDEESGLFRTHLADGECGSITAGFRYEQ